MAIPPAAIMSNDPNDNTNINVVDDLNNNNMSSSSNSKDEHEHDMVMPGFRFHPTEEELVEFYLRRKVEGKRFNVELITFLDLYRYDPWELPALAAIGEKEWFFYVPRDRKYRNGDRPNRVTTSGYWKATGADRMIRGENSRSIGLKKTLVFYSGKAPKGIRTSWIMNEYRLPHHETERYQKAEISLCRVYKRPGVEDHPSLPRCLPTRRSAESSRGQQSEKKYPQEAAQQAMERFQAFGGGQPQQMEFEKLTETDGSSSTSTSDVTTALGLSKQNLYRPMPPISTTLGLPSGMEGEGMFLNQSKQGCCSLLPNSTTLFPVGSSSVPSNVVDDLHRLVSYQQVALNQQQYYNTNHPHPHQQQHQPQSEFSTLPPQSQAQPQQLSLNVLPSALPSPTAFSDRLWEWNPIPEPNREYNNPFK
ncbi:NAC domain-containing protein 72-like [Gossypium australe]|uniref:NAC domain-containing protein 72-like n=1 Tax=Gossypium australe TaxID=47621 RepID=A0A5B6WDZ3_9ROSI|nr:NAC domain-containing protein 72-like [Gossypium australe]